MRTAQLKCCAACILTCRLDVFSNTVFDFQIVVGASFPQLGHKDHERAVLTFADRSANPSSTIPYFAIRESIGSSSEIFAIFSRREFAAESTAVAVQQLGFFRDLFDFFIGEYL